MEPDPGLPPAVVLRNEFSRVELRYVNRGDSVSLSVTDGLSGSEIVLDSTELESLARAPHEAFRQLLRDLDADRDEGS